ncbi:MAG TPA: histidine phosphatase family protein [Polyangiaceae bacterium]|nr:histidine phosphatase family protein [Polyangiaceae bacterium]
MDILLVRHGESEGNAQERMQGLSDFPLTERGQEQAQRLSAWLGGHGLEWERLYASPLKRAWVTAEILAGDRGAAPHAEPDLREIHAGALEGLTFEDITGRYPRYADRRITELGDFAEFDGEGYETVQARVRRVRERLEAEHRSSGDRVVLVGHGGFNYQLLKMLICEPVPRVNIVRMGNCSATLVRMRERRGTYMGELVWHVPVELMGGTSGEGAARLFR